DEPTNYLDKEGIALVGSLIETRVQHEGIVIVASHAVHSSFDAHILMMEDFALCSA
ncbi:MAG: heme ABC transporter ATP-binding protein CcmA, partial [Alphaproteobacteria bacterium]|nr:heme ABC transporter ATP-binding protein CcmA [Alphaproteobacteria bacterium]